MLLAVKMRTITAQPIILKSNVDLLPTQTSSVERTRKLLKWARSRLRTLVEEACF